MENLRGLKQAIMLHRLAGDEAQARQEAFERLCERSGVPQVLRKFPLQTKLELHDEADLQRDLAERQLEAQLHRRYSRLIDCLYQRQVLGREVVDEEEDHLLLPPVPEVQPVEAQDVVAPDGAPPEGRVVEVPLEQPAVDAPPPQQQLDVLDVDSDEAEPKQSWPVVPPVRDHWLSGALSTFLAEKESQAKKTEEEADEEADEAEAMVEEVEVEAKVKRKREDDKNDGEEETAPPRKKRSRDVKAKSGTNKSPRLTKRTQKEEDAPCSFRAEQTGTTTLVFYRPRPYYCAARDTEGFVWTGRSLLDEWDSTDDSPGSGFNRMWSLTRPKRLNLKKLEEACERVRNRPPTTRKGALFLARNVRLVRKSAATARLPTYPALLDVETTDSLGDIDDAAESQADDDDDGDYEEAVMEERREEPRRTRKRPRSEVVEDVVPKYGAPPSPPMGNRRRGVGRRKNGRTSTRTPPRARVTRRAAAAAAVSPATESGSKSVAAARAKPSTSGSKSVAAAKPSTTAATTDYSSSWPSPAPSLSPRSSSSSTKSRDSADRRRITPTTVDLPKAQPSSGRPISETTVAVAATTPQPPPPSLSRRTERVVEISFPLTPRTPTLRAGQNGGGSTRLRVVSRDDDEESLSDTDDPFAFPEF